jgi:hypothetical protein
VNNLLYLVGKHETLQDMMGVLYDAVAWNFLPDGVTAGTIISKLLAEQDMARARVWFTFLLATETNPRSLTAPFNMMIQHHAYQGDKVTALALLQDMQDRKIAYTPYTCSLAMFSHALLEPRDMSRAKAVLDSMPFPPNREHHTIMMAGYVLDKRADQDVVALWHTADKDARPMLPDVERLTSIVPEQELQHLKTLLALE